MACLESHALSHKRPHLPGLACRWTECAKQLRAKFTGLTGDMLLGAAVISYLGPFTATYREEVVRQWESGLAKVCVYGRKGGRGEQALTTEQALDTHACQDSQAGAGPPHEAL